MKLPRTLRIPAALAILTVGCTGVSGSPAATTAPTAAPTSASGSPAASAPGELTSVRFQLEWLPQAQFAGFLVAKDKGFYEEEGLDVEILPGGPNVVPLQQLTGGAADLALGPVTLLYTAREQGLPIKAIAQTLVRDPQVLVAEKASGIAEPRDLEGKSVGVWTAGGQNLEFEALMRSVGLDPKTDVTQVSIGFTLDAFLNKEVEATAAFYFDELLILYDRGYSPDDLSIIRYDDFGVGTPYSTIIGTEEYLAGNRETAVKFVRASVRGWQYALENEEEAVDIIMANVLQGAEISYTREQQEQSLPLVGELVAPDGPGSGDLLRIDETVYRQVADMVLEAGLVKEPVELQATFDASIWEEAAQ